MSTAIRFAERMSRLGTEGAFEVLARARKLEAEGKRIVHLEIGEPDFATPDNIVEAAIGAMQNGYTHYTPASGIYEAREAVAGFVGRTLSAQVDPSEVVLVPGSKNVLLFTLLACVEPGDEVILPDPGYPAYASQVEFIGGVAKRVTLREETGFRMDLDELASLVTPKTRMLIINTPQNPTIEALGSPESEHAVRRMVKVFEHRRDLVVDGINEIPGMRCARPQGAFYAFPNIEGTGFDEHELANRLLNEAGVAVLPGTAFGHAGKGFIRLAYTQSEDELKLGLRRIKEIVAAHRH